MPYRSGVQETERSAGVETGLLRSDQDRLMEEQDKQHKSQSNLSSLADQAVVSVAKRLRLGSLKGQFSVPDDSDCMGQEEIADLFEGIAEH